MFQGGITMRLLCGPKIPVPAPAPLMESLQKVEVTHSDEERSGFQLTFSVSEAGSVGTIGRKKLMKTLLGEYNRVSLMVVFGAKARSLIDGVITNRQLKPGEEPGQATLIITGEDATYYLDRDEESTSHPGQPHAAVALKLIGKHAKHGLVPKVIPPGFVDPPNPIDGVPTQQGTDLAYLRKLAQQNGYVFYISPGKAPLASEAYWGPPIRTGPPQSALTVNMGPESNVDSIDFQQDSTKAKKVEGQVQDPKTGAQMPIPARPSTRTPLSAKPPWLKQFGNIGTRRIRVSGKSMGQAMAEAQAQTDKSMDEVVKASGTLDAVAYGDILRPRKLVGLRGAKFDHDGIYYVKSVTHKLQPGQYKQDFKLTREGLGSTVSTVPA